MKCIDFDKAFSMYAMKYFREHAKEYKNYDAMEAAMPDVYARFLDTPADFLANQKPGEYFQSWDDAKVLDGGLYQAARAHARYAAEPHH